MSETHASTLPGRPAKAEPAPRLYTAEEVIQLVVDTVPPLVKRLLESAFRDSLERLTAQAQHATPGALATYLRSKGWVPEGDELSNHCLWLDPTQPTQEQYSSVQVLPERRSKRDSGQPLPPIVQTVLLPRVWPIPTSEAVSLQRGRDAAAAKELKV